MEEYEGTVSVPAESAHPSFVSCCPFGGRPVQKGLLSARIYAWALNHRTFRELSLWFSEAIHVDMFDDELDGQSVCI